MDPDVRGADGVRPITGAPSSARATTAVTPSMWATMKNLASGSGVTVVSPSTEANTETAALSPDEQRQQDYEDFRRALQRETDGMTPRFLLQTLVYAVEHKRGKYSIDLDQIIRAFAKAHGWRLTLKTVAEFL